MKKIKRFYEKITRNEERHGMGSLGFFNRFYLRMGDERIEQFCYSLMIFLFIFLVAFTPQLVAATFLILLIILGLGLLVKIIDQVYDFCVKRNNFTQF